MNSQRGYKGTKTERIKALEERINDLKKRWPAHSVSPALFQELEDLEDALERALAESEGRSADGSSASAG